MIQRFAPRASRFNRHRQILLNLGLADEFVQALRPQLQLKRGIVLDRRGGDDAVFQVGIVLGEGH